MNDIERRYARGAVELRTLDDRNTLAGYAAAFNRSSQNLGGFIERIAPGAFTRTLSHAGDVTGATSISCTSRSSRSGVPSFVVVQSSRIAWNANEE